MHAGLDFAYPEASKIGGLISGPPEQGQGTAESPSGWVIAVERCKRKPQDQPSEEASTSDANGASSPPGETTGLRILHAYPLAQIMPGALLQAAGFK